MSLPEPVANTDWAQSGGSASKSMGHLALGTALTRAFTVQAGRGSSLTARLASAPIVANGHVYTIDTLGAVRAFDARNGAQFWASQTPDERGNEASLYGGGIAYDNGRIYATNGLGYVAAIDERNGGIVWKVRPGGPLRGAPSDRQRRAVRDQPGQPDLRAQRSGRIDQLVGRGFGRNRRDCSDRRPPRSARAPSSPASRRASSTPTATRTAAKSGRTRCSAPASARASRRCRTSMPTR